MKRDFRFGFRVAGHISDLGISEELMNWGGYGKYILQLVNEEEEQNAIVLK